MIASFFKRLAFGLLLALVAGMLAVVFTASASEPPQAANPPDCAECHTVVTDDWAHGPHATALTNEAFQADWQAKGSPQECLACHTTGYDPQTGTWQEGGVTCVTCHKPVPADHPEQSVMPTKITPETCGQCHLDPFAEFELSGHHEVAMNCQNCHSPHTGELKADSPEQMCQTCHKQEVHYYKYTEHALNNVTCVDCHLRVKNVESTQGHSNRQHVFEANVESCNGCHSDGMHLPENKLSASVVDTLTTEALSLLPPDETLQIAPISEPATTAAPSATAYVLVAMLVGLMGGMILAPYAGNLLPFMNRSNDDDR
ncbi:MAG: hypothetical protein EPO32_13465 [Anaerolineae bacterium]|nr:MAG: hypothetical protein EPO32_13465 [Anaerolineae bacterium]